MADYHYEVIAANLFSVLDQEVNGVKARLKKVIPYLLTIAVTLCAGFILVAFLLRPQPWTLEVDAISGATFTSDTVLKAIENAFEDVKKSDRK